MNFDNVVKGQCHCGKVTLNVQLLDGLSTARRCTCSLCRMRKRAVCTLGNELIFVQQAGGWFGSAACYLSGAGAE